MLNLAKQRSDRKRGLCGDCRKNTFDPYGGKHYYMVFDSIWKKYGNGFGLLCWDCLEKRMGRAITAEDLTDCPLNASINEHTSKLLGMFHKRKRRHTGW